MTTYNVTAFNIHNDDKLINFYKPREKWAVRKVRFLHFPVLHRGVQVKGERKIYSKEIKYAQGERSGGAEILFDQQLASSYVQPW